MLTLLVVVKRSLMLILLEVVKRSLILILLMVVKRYLILILLIYYEAISDSYIIVRPKITVISNCNYL